MHIIFLKSVDIDYARAAFKHYDELLPWMRLGEGVKEAMK
jgi:hypothetical protein